MTRNVKFLLLNVPPLFSVVTHLPSADALKSEKRGDDFQADSPGTNFV